MLAAIALIAITLSSPGQGARVRREEAPPPLPTGDWRTVDAGGGFRFEYFFAWKPYELVEPDHEVFPWDICSNQCRQKMHSKHAECDKSCDEPCETQHHEMIGPIWKSNLSQLYSWLSETFRTLNNTKPAWSFKSRGEGTVEAISTDFQTAFIDPATTGDYRNEAIKVFPGDHQPEACGRVRFRYKLGRATLVMKYKLYDISGQIGEGEYTPAGYVYAPLHGHPRETIEYGSGPCLCKPDETQTSHYYEPSGTGLQPSGVWIDEGNTGKYVLATAPTIARHGIQILCSSMSEFEVVAEHPTVPISVLVNPGAVLKPLDPAYQDVLLASRVQAKFSPAQTLFASITPVWPPSKGVAACLNMNKQMPNRSTKYRISVPTDGRVALLGRVGADQGSSGPWDQARVWIYTDGATLEKVNEKMLLGVTPTQYVNELYNLETKVAVDLTKPKFRACLSPSLLLGKAGPSASIEWFAEKMSKLDSKAVAEFLNAKRAEFAELLSGLTVARQRLHTIGLMNGLLRGGDPGVQLAALKLLNEHADAAELKILLSNRGLPWAGRLLHSADPAVAGEALTLFERLDHPYALSFLPKPANAPAELRPRVLALATKMEAMVKAGAPN